MTIHALFSRTTGPLHATLLRAAAVAAVVVSAAVAEGDPVTCPPSTCGGNSPYVELLGSTVPIAELDLDGGASADGVRLDPTSLVAPRCATGPVRLDVDDGRLIARGPTAADRCTGEQLLGASFRITIGDSIAQTIAIAGITRTWEWHRDQRQWRKDLEAYLLVQSDPRRPELRPIPLCRLDQPWLDPQNAGDLVTDADLIRADRYAVLVVGEIYDRDAASVARTGASRWFNLACQGGALAKMRVLGYDPSRADTTPAQRQAALRMITARYRGERSYTVQGARIIWVNRDGPPPAEPLGDLEAIWNEDGALVVAEPRACAADPGSALCQESRAVAGQCGGTTAGEWITYNPAGRGLR